MVTKNIDLLPLELRYGFFKRILLYQQSHFRNFVFYGLSALCLAFLVISITQSVMTSKYVRKASSIEEAIRKIQARHKESTNIMTQITQAKEALGFQTALLNKRIQFLKSQYRFGHHWAMTLAELQRIIPKGVWFIGVKTENYYLKIQGGALEEKLVTVFMAALRKSPVFSNVFFNYTQNSMVGKTKVILFEITCNYDMQFMQQKKES